MIHHLRSASSLLAFYYEPLGGRAFGDFNRYSHSTGAVGAVSGEGRSYNAGVTVKF